jgi:hypothetical protein
VLVRGGHIVSTCFTFCNFLLFFSLLGVVSWLAAFRNIVDALDGRAVTRFQLLLLLAPPQHPSDTSRSWFGVDNDIWISSSSPIYFKYLPVSSSYLSFSQSRLASPNRLHICSILVLTTRLGERIIRSVHVYTQK